MGSACGGHCCRAFTASPGSARAPVPPGRTRALPAQPLRLPAERVGGAACLAWAAPLPLPLLRCPSLTAADPTAAPYFPLCQDYERYIGELKAAYPEIYVGWVGRCCCTAAGAGGTPAATASTAAAAAGHAHAHGNRAARAHRRCAPPSLAWWTATPCSAPLRGAPPSTRRPSRRAGLAGAGTTAHAARQGGARGSWGAACRAATAASCPR